MGRRSKPKAPPLCEVERSLARGSLLRYNEYVHEGRWVAARHLAYLCKRVQDFLDAPCRGPYGILLVQLPPQHGKSMCLTETLPSYYLGRNPEKRVLAVSYNEEFARLFGRRNRRKLERFGKELFGVGLASHPCGDGEFETEQGGGMLSRGILSGITGRPGDLILIDDPVKNRQEADSEAYRESVWDAWQSTLKTRLAAGAKVILVMTRWHEDDLAGRLLRLERGCESLRLPCEAEEDDPLGREPGEPLFPELGKGREWLSEMKRSYEEDPGMGGARDWSALYQGRPSPAHGNLVKDHWWRYHSPAGPSLPPVAVRDGRGAPLLLPAAVTPERFDLLLQSWDCTFKDGENSDYVCGGVLGRRQGRFYLLEAVNARMGIVDTITAIRRMSDRWPGAVLKLIESKANGPAIIELLSRSLPGLIPVEPRGSKAARAQAVLPLIESGSVFLPHPQTDPITPALTAQWAAFPGGAHDDMVDMLTQGLHRLMRMAPAPDGEEALTGYYSPDELSDLKRRGLVTGNQASRYLREESHKWQGG